MDLWRDIKGTLQAYRVTFGYLFRKPATIQYPEEKRTPAPRYRARMVLTRDPDGNERCVACHLCSAACPVDCISMQAAEAPDGRRYAAWFRINFARCIFCGLCAEACPTLAIQMSPEYEISSRDPLTLVYEKADLLIDGGGKDREYDFYRHAGIGVANRAAATPTNTVPSTRERWYREMMASVLFYLLAAATLAATLLCITRTNPVHAVIYLVYAFLDLALIFYLLGAPLVAAWEMIIYAGAIMVLFLFIIMMLELAPGGKQLAIDRQRWIPVLLLSLVTLGCTVMLIALDPSTAASGALYHATPRDFGAALFGRYALAVQVVSFQLLFAAVGAYYVGRGEPREDGEQTG